MDDEIDPQAGGEPDPQAQQSGAEGGAPEAAEAPEQSMLDAITDALKEGETEDPSAQAADDRPRGPDGRFLPKEGAGDKTPEEPGKPADDDAFKEPEGLTPGAQERFQSLVGMVKERNTQIEQLRAQEGEVRQAVEGFRQMITESGASDQEIVALFDFARAIKSGNWSAAEPMLAHLTQQYRVATGRDPNGADPFAQHPDLAQRVQAGELAAEIAIEVVKARQVIASAQQAEQAARTQQQSQQQYQTAASEAAQQVKTLVQKWSSTDLDWPRKQALLQSHATEIAKRLPPDQWGFALESAYSIIGQTMAAPAQGGAPTRQAPSSTTPQPLRPAAASAGRREPASMLEAVSGAIEAS